MQTTGHSQIQNLPCRCNWSLVSTENEEVQLYFLTLSFATSAGSNIHSTPDIHWIVG